MPLVTGVDLPDFMTAAAVHHGTLPCPEDGPIERELVARALAILTGNSVPLAAFTALGQCLTEGARVGAQTLTRPDRVNVILDLTVSHIDGALNPRNHPGYPALRAARVAEADRWANLFRAEGWQVTPVHHLAPERLGFVLTPPATASTAAP
ncbi:hypothetical protein AB0D66_22115 [Streptomyces sp. NPDC048270]|uniref:hypothetical protein n=1 Tax=Streptomyces sp. NPDC048270 TaxID=3154615 RepID=UPI00340E88B0